MSNETLDPRWPKLLSLAVHEFRTPITVAAGYLRMVLKERAGPVTEQQRKLLEEAERSCGRLSALVAEMSELSALEGGHALFNPGTLELGDVIRDAVGALPELPDDRTIAVVVDGADGPMPLRGDATRLRAALSSILIALRREVVDSDRLCVQVSASDDAWRLAIGTPAEIEATAAADPSSLDVFDEWRGGTGLSLAIARRIIGQHGGTLKAPPRDSRAGAVVTLPRAGSA
jgi:signal transduction histidine kinase